MRDGEVGSIRRELGCIEEIKGGWKEREVYEER